MDEERPKTEVISSEAFANEGGYLSLKVGEKVKITIKQIEKVLCEPDFALAKRDYKYELVGADNERLSINAWILYNEIKRLIPLEGKTLQINHRGEKDYEVTVIESGEVEVEKAQVE